MSLSERLLDWAVAVAALAIVIAAIGHAVARRRRGQTYALELALPLAVAVSLLIAGTLNPPDRPAPRSGPVVRVFAIEDDGWVGLYRLDRDGDGRPRLVPDGEAVRYEPRDRRPR
jgi:hypothetical protein